MSTGPDSDLGGDIGGDIGGDPVCWLQYACPECGAMPSDDAPQRCWRCGEPLVPSEEETPPRADRT
ncbi:hypothetical protein [Pseudonocardia humida]|uniref:Uncharacterized protein n=1 Tax=Pseudonocardia humida TaxID=2800819 RepID=A0ABT1A1Y2_9PSEU|nr:hypothetical protein [Pseudonocardia humida]MCO1657016.1 hypothetical protein [Pseudonocardia humida]